MKKSFHITTAGKKELEAELSELKAQRGPVTERLKIARGFGDLSENAEYDSARHELERVESRIKEIEYILQNGELIKESKAQSVRLGSTVTLKNDSGQSRQFTLVGTIEADPLEGKISDESPIGRALLNKKVGEEVEIRMASDVVSYKIQTIS